MPMDITLIIPKVHRRAGTEKCLSWLIEDLAREHRVTVYTSSIEDTDLRGVRVVKLPTLPRPAIAKYLTFFLANTLVLGLKTLLRHHQGHIVNATGCDSLFANVVSVHYSCVAWRDLLRRGEVKLPARSWRQHLRNLHYRWYFELTARMEALVYARKGIRLFIAVSEGMKRNLVAYYGVPPEKILVVPNAADEGVCLGPAEREAVRSRLRRGYGIGPDEIVLLFLAAGDWKRKGLDLVLEALARLPGLPLRLLVVGREDIEYYQARAQELGQGERVIFCGPTQRVADYYAAADLFVYPSHFEAFALVTLEAAAAGLPLIVSRISGTEELVQEGENGFFVRHDPEDIARRIRQLAQDAELRQRLSLGARQTAAAYTRQEVVRRMVAAYQLALATASGDGSP